MINRKLLVSVGNRPHRVFLRLLRAYLYSLISRDKRKVFCIGFNKTGTSSLHRLYLDLGLQSVHNVDWPTYSRLYRQRRSYYGFQCYSDGERADFAFLDGAFPGSLFILNTRDERAWLRSRVKHAMRFNLPLSTLEAIQHPRLGVKSEDYYSDPGLAIYEWACSRRLYHKQVRSYFHDNARFIEIDVTSDAGWAEKLHALLKLHDFKLKGLTATSTALHENRRGEDAIERAEELDAAYTLIDEVLATLGPEDSPARP